MACEATITRWLLERKKSLELKILEMDWSGYWPDRIFDFEMTFTLDGRPFRGRGTDSDETRALEKAGSEALERAFCHILGVSTHGMAVHPDPACALANSRMEAIERFLFGQHLKMQIPFTEIKNAVLANHTADVMVRFFAMTDASEGRGVVCHVQDRNQNFIGLGFEAHQSSAIQKSLIEASRNLIAYRENPDGFISAVHANPDLWCADNAWIEKLFPLFSFDHGENRKIAPKLKIDSQLIKIEVLAPFFNSCPVALASTSCQIGKAS